jgi:hypothetical protein
VVATSLTGSAHTARAANWTPFAPHGWLSIGRAASTLMLSFVGWEAVAPLTGRLRAGQLSRVIGIAFTVTAVLYLGLAVATVSCLGRGSDLTVPLADLLQMAIGPAGRALAAVAALVLTAGSVNAYLSGATEMLHELTAVSGRIEPNGPDPSPRLSARAFLAFIALTGLVLIALSALRLADFAALVGVPTTMFVCVYLGCTASAARILSGPARVAAAVAVLAVLAILAFSGWALLAAAAVAAVAATAGHGGYPKRAGYRARGGALFVKAPGGAAVRRIAMLVPAHSHAGRRALTSPFPVAFRARSTGDSPAGRPGLSSSASTAASSSGRVTICAGRRSGAGLRLVRMPAPPRRTGRRARPRPARSIAPAHPAVMAPRWRPYVIRMEAPPAPAVTPAQPAVTTAPAVTPAPAIALTPWPALRLVYTSDISVHCGTQVRDDALVGEKILVNSGLRVILVHHSTPNSPTSPNQPPKSKTTRPGERKLPDGGGDDLAGLLLDGGEVRGAATTRWRRR